tara:strand:+ start:2845 stop:3195 length:351 start_codon:yes stop_codon:yes gene_type:complete
MDPYTKLYKALLESRSVLEDTTQLDDKTFSVSSRASSVVRFVQEALDDLAHDYLECESDDCTNMFLSVRGQRFCCDNCSGRMRGKKFRYRKRNPILAAIDDAQEAARKELEENKDA